MAPRLPQEVRDLIDLTRRGIGAVDAVLGRFWADVQAVLARFANRPLVRADRLAIMRHLDTIIDRVYGLTRQAALISSLFTTIGRVADVATETPFARLLERTRNLVERRQPGFWQRIRGKAMIEPSDPFLKVVAEWEYVDEFGNRIVPRSVREGRAARARLVDSRQELSRIVWKQGRETRMGIDSILREGIRNGEDSWSIARRLEPFLNPDMQPVTIRQDGKVVRRNQTRYPGRGGFGSYPSRRLARTEVSKAFLEATREAAAVTPGVVGMRWRLSAQHPKQDICDQYAAHDEGLGHGVYPVKDYPSLPHPQCLCTALTVTVSREEMISQLIAKYGDKSP